jgi:WD40 repeat protein
MLKSISIIIVMLFYVGLLGGKAEAQSGHRIRSLAWNVDHSHLAVGYDTGFLEIISSDTLEILQTFRVSEIAGVSVNMDVVWHPQNPYLVAVTSLSSPLNASVKIYDVSVGQQLSILLPAPTIHQGETINAVDWSPDGTKIAGVIGFLGPAPTNRYVTIWDTTTGEIIQELPSSSDVVNAVDWSPDGRWIASGTGDKTILVWDAESGILARTLEGHTFSVYDVAWSPDGSRLASASNIGDTTIRIWDVTTGQNISTMTTPGAYEIVWSSNGSYIASRRALNLIYIWDVSTGAQIDVIEAENSVGALAWNRATNELSFGTNSGEIYQIDLGFVQKEDAEVIKN